MGKRTSTKSKAKKASSTAKSTRKKTASTKAKSVKSAKKKSKKPPAKKVTAKTTKKGAKKTSAGKKKATSGKKVAGKSADKKTTVNKKSSKTKTAAKKKAAKKNAAKKGKTTKTPKKTRSASVNKKAAKGTNRKKKSPPSSRTTAPPPAPIRSPSHLDTRNLGRKAVQVADIDAPLPKSKLTTRELKDFERLLLAKRNELLGNMNHLTESARGQSDSDSGGRSGGMPTHMADVGSDNWEQEFTFGLIENERTLIREIDDALGRIRDGSYGVCLATHKPIAKSRLKAKPWAKYCIEYARLRDLGRVP